MILFILFFIFYETNTLRNEHLLDYKDQTYLIFQISLTSLNSRTELPHITRSKSAFTPNYVK